jgi:threonine aldolase
MYAYAVQASLGDDVYFDPSTKVLEDHIARLTGKEAALFVPSGTMSNQLAIRAHLKQPPFSVLVDHRSHMNKFVHPNIFVHVYLDQIFQVRYETGGAAFHSGATLHAVIPANSMVETTFSSQYH